MSKLRMYLSRNFWWILLFIILIISQTIYLFLNNVDVRDIIYGAGIDFFVFMVFMVINFCRYVKKVNILNKIYGSAVGDYMDFPAPKDDIEQKYQDIIENINIYRKDIESKDMRARQEMIEYYSMWVHQIKTPIAAMKLLLQVNDFELKDDIEEELLRIEQYADMALQYQRINSDTNDFVLKKVELDGVVRDSIRKYAKIIIRKKLSINYKGTDISIVSDEKWLDFVIGQILSNAVKYSKKGEIEITCTRENDIIYLTISDEGMGISKEDIPLVFEKGYTGYNGRSDKYSTGIGLYLCKQVLNKLSHSIRIESEVGKGTSVIIGFGDMK